MTGRLTARLRKWLSLPLTRGLCLDDPMTTELRRHVVRTKPFLRQIYEEWYRLIRESLPPGEGAVLELGSGPGFLRELLPGAITSEVFLCPGTALVADGQRLPCSDGSLRAIVMVDVFHHLPNCRLFLAEAARCIRPGGSIVAIEPWVTSWSRVVHGHLHHEPFQPDSPAWDFPPSGPLSGANGALPWIVFHRDRPLFEREFPEWRIKLILPFMPIRYLLSGGVGMRSLVPGATYPFFRFLERLAAPANDRLAMFAQLVIERTDVARG